MRTRRWLIAAICLNAAMAAIAAAEPKPTAVDIKAFRDQLLVFQDAKGGTYLVLLGPDKRIFYGTKTALYEQRTTSSSTNGDAWSISALSPRLPNFHDAQLRRNQDGTFVRDCDGLDDAALTQITGDKAKQIIAKASVLTSATLRWPRLLARDDTGVYYYVDHLAEAYGGKGERVFVGKKGGMVQVPLDEVASDSAGDVFSTKRGELRLVSTKGGDAKEATWIKGEKRTSLVTLDPQANSQLIFRDLGIYDFIGTLCENI